MSNSLITSNIIAKEAVAILENMLNFTSNVNTEWESEYTSNISRGYAPGATVNIPKPPRYIYRDGRVAAPQATTESSVPITLVQGGADISFTSFERTLSLSRLENKLQAAMATIANKIDQQGLEMARFATFNTLGTPGVAPSTQALALDAVTGIQQRLDEMAAPRDRNRNIVLSPALNAKFVTGFAGMFNSQEKLTKQYGSGMMVDSLGIAYSMDQNVPTHVNGTQVVTGTAVTAGQTGANITVGALAGTITKGTVVTFPGVFAVNPQSRASTGTLAQFVVTADLAASATSLPVSPPMVATGAFQNVTNATTAANFAIFGTAGGSYTTSIAYHKDAFTFASVPMAMPQASTGIKAHQETYKGITLKVTDYYDGVNDVVNTRFDVLTGWAATYPELAVKYAL